MISRSCRHRPPEWAGSALDWVAGRLPRGKTALHRAGVVAALTEQCRGALAARVATVAHVSVSHHRVAPWHLAEPSFELVPRDVPRARKVPGRVLFNVAYVDDGGGVRLPDALAELGRRDKVAISNPFAHLPVAS